MVELPAVIKVPTLSWRLNLDSDNCLCPQFAFQGDRQGSVSKGNPEVCRMKSPDGKCHHQGCSLIPHPIETEWYHEINSSCLTLEQTSNFQTAGRDPVVFQSQCWSRCSEEVTPGLGRSRWLVSQTPSGNTQRHLPFAQRLFAKAFFQVSAMVESEMSTQTWKVPWHRGCGVFLFWVGILE